MKVEKLYTLSQFVELCESEIPMSPRTLPREYYFDKVCEYNDFLKQPLKKEMFVNSINYSPNAWELGVMLENKKLWTEAEKKVIFNSSKALANHAWRNISTLYELAERTHGSLELKNVEL